MNTWSGPLGLTCTLQIAWWSGVPSKIVPNILVWHTSVARLEWSFRNPDKEISIFIANYTNCHLTHKPHYPEHNRWSLGGEWLVQTQLCYFMCWQHWQEVQTAVCSLFSLLTSFEKPFANRWLQSPQQKFANRWLNGECCTEPAQPHIYQAYIKMFCVPPAMSI